MVCAVQMMRNGGENENKVMALDSWGHWEPIVVISKDEPQFSDERKFVQACKITVRIVAVRGDNHGSPRPAILIAAPVPRCS